MLFEGSELFRYRIAKRKHVVAYGGSSGIFDLVLVQFLNMAGLFSFAYR